MEMFGDDSRFSQMISQRLNEEDRQVFNYLYKMYVLYGNDDNKFVVVLDDVWQWLGFSRIDPCKRLLVNNFEENVHYIIESFKNNPFPRGGHNRQIVKMTVNTFKKLSMKACTHRSNEIYDYYIKLDQTFLEYTQMRLNETNLNIQRAKDLERHNVMVESYKSERLVYVMKVQTLLDNEFVIKIGKTHNLPQRVDSLRSEFRGDVFVLDVYVCDNPERFERFMHSHSFLKSMRYLEPINGVKKSTECYLVNGDMLIKVTELMDKHVNDYNHKSVEEIHLELEEKRLRILDIIIQNKHPNTRELIQAMNFTYLNNSKIQNT